MARTPTTDRLALLAELERKVLWLASWTIHHANHGRDSRDGLKVGGHQASSASLATIMTALYFAVLKPEDRVAVKPHASPNFHAIQYLLGNQTLEKLRLISNLETMDYKLVQIVLVGQPELDVKLSDYTMRQILEMVGEITGKKVPKRNMPTGILKALRPFGPLVGKIMDQPPNLAELISSADGVTFWADASKARRKLGWTPREAKAGLRDTLAAEGRL